MDIESYVTASNLRTGSLVIFWVEFAISAYLLTRQYQHLSNRQWQPPKLKKYPHYTEGIYHLAAIQQQGLLWQDIKIKLFTTSIFTVTICSDVFPFMWDSFQLADSEFDFTPDFMPLEMRQDISFGFWFAIFELLVLEFPYKFFQRQLLQADGFYNKSMLFYTRRNLGETIMQTMHKTITSFFLSFFINIYDEQTQGYHTFLRHAGLSAIYCVSLFFFETAEAVFAYMDRDTFRPLPPGQLKDRCKAICQRTGYPIQNVYIEDVPIEFPMNAYCVSYFGFYTRIVFISSMIGGYYPQEKGSSPGLTLNELEGIFAHEVGHWKRRHNEQNAIFYNMFYEPILFALAMTLREQKIVFEAFHFSPADTESLPYPLLPGLTIAQQIVLRMPNEGVHSLYNIHVCDMELDADNHAVSIGYGESFKAGLVRLKTILVGFPSSDYIFTLFYDHHPTLLARIEAVDNTPRG